MLLLFLLLLLSGCGAAAVTHQTLGNVDTTLAVAPAPTPDRKVIFEASIKLIVADLSKLEQDLPKLVKEHGGYLAHVSIDRTHGHYLTGHWVARVPVAKYEPFLAVVSKLGAPDTFDQKSQDVSEEFVDLEARIANEKRLEERILELLKKPEGEIKEVIEVERELARVRGEIEKMEGRVRFLTDRTAYTTITIDAVERETYVAAPPPGLWTRVAQTWSESLNALRQLAEDILVGLVAILPWLVVATVICVALWSLLRSRKRRVKTVV
jgi:hypothetical protein